MDRAQPIPSGGERSDLRYKRRPSKPTLSLASNLRVNIPAI